MGLNLVDPRDDATADMDGVSESRALDDREHLRGAPADLAVQDNRSVGGQITQRGAAEELTLRDEDGTRDCDDLELARLADVDEHEVALTPLTLLKHGLELAHRDRGVDRGIGGSLGDRAAERVVVDQAGDRLALGVLRILTWR